MTSLHPAQHLTFSRRSVAALAAAVLFLAGCGEEAKTTAADAAAASKTTPAQQAPIPVGVVQLVEHEALDATVKGFIDELAARGFKDGENIRIDHTVKFFCIKQRFFNGHRFHRHSTFMI
jgi:putative ABC transport system substrate-binding protein